MNLPAAQQQPQVGLAAQPRQQFDLSPQTFEQAIQFCDYLAESDLVPKDFKGKPANCLIAIQWGAELGLKPLQALQNLAIINGRPALWGDAVIALVRSSPLCEYITEADDGGTAVCRVKRRGESEEVRNFSMDDAKVAGLLGKSGPWTQYPKRMRQMRARAFALRDVFPDVLRGMPIAEEVMDIPQAGAASNEQPRAAIESQADKRLPLYSEADFSANLPKWWNIIASGRKSADDLIATLQTKARFTADQLQEIRNPPKDEADADQAPTDAASAADGATQTAVEG
ncbi:hypothetical protein R1H25_17805 [Stenotrophomonas sp. C2852]|uniref:hypothetical protein n=1 Tax=Stenotrophomonas sp. C2852 TaxID=3077845 RepID=UPI00293CA378|nr:hypothetical protein [Stenotrophomonas sp. C2852]MDV3437318.1 hypothetical protein [Stenotrophomonas sp. C2852]